MDEPTTDEPTMDEPRTDEPTIDHFSARALEWLERHATRRLVDRDAGSWGCGEFDVAVFHNLSYEDEQGLLQQLCGWQQRKATVGYHAINWPIEHGGLGLSTAYARAFAKLESQFEVPSRHETFSVTTGLIAPTIRQFGTPQQIERHLASFLAAQELCCQLFSEPGAGSDLASLSCRAVRDGDEWIINGQKVWSSGAQFSQWGELIARSDPTVAKHKGMTAFIISMDLPGIEVRPIKQMSGGTSFNEVFFDSVRVPDTMRLGAEGDGWKVAMTTLGYERDHSGSGGGGARPGGSWSQLLRTARALDVTHRASVRSVLTDVYIHMRVEGFVNRRAADLRKAGAAPGPEGSLGKLLWTQGMTRTSDAVSSILGAKLIADTGEWGTFAWGEHVLGAPGYRIAGGSDEVQRNIIGERVLGLPAEPRWPG
jgi:alkylation response protein AidB-like acyl-CoA dehydrogenase